MARGLLHLGGQALAIDLGTANTVIYRRGEGVVLFEPSVVAVDERTGEVQAVGEHARRMIGRTPASISATRPLRDGVVADFDMTEQMLRYFIARANGRRASAQVVACIPSGITDVERRAVEEAALAAGARRAYLIEEPLAGAIGAGLPVSDAQGTMIVDIGGGTSEVAVLSLGGMVVSRSLRVGGYEMDDAIVRYVRDEHKLLIGPERAERVKIEIGSAFPMRHQEQAEVAGRDALSGLLRRTRLNSDEVRTALARPVAQIVEAVKDALEQTPPELASDISGRGLELVGGGALLRGIDERLRRETGLPVHIVDAPLICVAQGAGQTLEELPALERSARAARRSGRPGGRPAPTAFRLRRRR